MMYTAKVAMQTNRVFDYAVVGAGIAGASVAYRLSAQGADVVVLDQEAQPGYHATGRSAAMFIETYGGEQIRALTRASRGFLLDPPEGFCVQPILAPRGVLYAGAVGQEDLLAAACDAYRAQSLEFERLDVAQALALVPCLVESRTIGAIHDPVAREIDVDTLHQGFLRGMRQHATELVYNAPLQAAQRVADHWSLHTPAVTLRARTIVDAAGAWADSVAALCGATELGIQPMRRSAFLFAAPDDVDCSHWPTVLAADESYYFKPEAGALLGSPANADPVPPQDVVAEELDIATGIYHIEQATSLRIHRPSHVWAGLRSFAPDHELVIGWDDRVEGFFWLAGQGGYGIQTSAAASELAAALLLDTPLSQSLQAFGVDADVVNPTRLRG